MTIDELARRVDMTARNIREWQTNGLLPPPERRGRVGIYTDDSQVADRADQSALGPKGFRLM